MSPRSRRARRQQARAAERHGQTQPRTGLAAWVGEPPDVLFVVLLIFALGLRAYYFTLTKDQPLWWDEAEYMLKAKALALGTPDTGWWEARPILLPFLGAGLLTIGLGEVTIRLAWIVLSTATLALIYRISTILFNKRVGVCAVALASVSYIDVFYAMRILVDGPQVFFVTLAALLMVSSQYAKGGRYGAGAVFPVLVVGVALRFTAAIFVPVVVAFLLATRGMAALKARAWHVSVALGVLVALPMLLYFWHLYGNPFHPFFSHMVLRGPLSSGGGPSTLTTEVFMQYVRFLPDYTAPILVAAFAAGLIEARSEERRVGKECRL